MTNSHRLFFAHSCNSYLFITSHSYNDVVISEQAQQLQNKQYEQ